MRNFPTETERARESDDGEWKTWRERDLTLENGTQEIGSVCFDRGEERERKSVYVCVCVCVWERERERERERESIQSGSAQSFFFSLLLFSWSLLLLLPHCLLINLSNYFPEGCYGKINMFFILHKSMPWQSAKCQTSHSQKSLNCQGDHCECMDVLVGVWF